MQNAITNFAKELGFDLVTFTSAKIPKRYSDIFKNWLKEGHKADMGYMEKIEQRADIEKLLPGAKTVIVLGTNYYYEQDELKLGYGRIARYAYGRDYHKIIRKRLKKLEKFIQEIGSENCLTRSYVDTGPILERAFAEQSGLGRIGKNGCLITEKFGSWVFISEIITNIDLKDFSKSIPGDNSPKSRWSDSSEKPFNICGNCTKCITSCPTGAIIAPGIIDARLCISYLTIENKEKIPLKLAKIIKKTKRIFGCDICQEVCPQNLARQKDSHKSVDPIPQFQTAIGSLSSPKIAGDQLSLAKIKKIKTDEEFLTLFAGSPLMRAKRKGMQRNVN